MFPLSFEEYLDMKKFYQKPIDANLMIELNSYLTEGGFPKALQYDNLADKRTYVKLIIEEIFEKDIKSRVKIKNREAFEKVKKILSITSAQPRVSTISKPSWLKTD